MRLSRESLTRRYLLLGLPFLCGWALLVLYALNRTQTSSLPPEAPHLTHKPFARAAAAGLAGFHADPSQPHASGRAPRGGRQPTSESGAGTAQPREPRSPKEVDAVLVAVIAHVADPSVGELVAQVRRGAEKMASVTGERHEVCLFVDVTKGDADWERYCDCVKRMHSTRTLDRFKHPRHVHRYVNKNIFRAFLLLENQVHKYRYVWTLEQDVRFSGEWFDFFSAFTHSPADLIGLVRFDPADGFGARHCTYCTRQERMEEQTTFIPVSRFSPQLLDAIFDVLQGGLTGHHGRLSYQICNRNTWCVIETIPPSLVGAYGANHALTEAQFLEELANRGDEGKNKLYHPVKSWKHAGEEEEEVEEERQHHQRPEPHFPPGVDAATLRQRARKALERAAHE